MSKGCACALFLFVVCATAAPQYETIALTPLSSDQMELGPKEQVAKHSVAQLAQVGADTQSPKEQAATPKVQEKLHEAMQMNVDQTTKQNVQQPKEQDAMNTAHVITLSDRPDVPYKAKVSPSVLKNVHTESTNHTMLDIVVVIPTVRRYQSNGDPAPERYLQPLVTKLLGDLTPEQREHVQIFILNSDKEPLKHVEAEDLKHLPQVTVFHKPGSHDVLVQSVAGFDSLEDGREVNSEWLSWVASENADGAYLFTKARKVAPYILFLEDDVLPTTNALAKLSNFVHNFDKDDWLFLDLYTPNLDWADGMLTFHNGEKYNFQCCTQAMLFRSDRIDGVIRYWMEHPREPVDDNLRHYMEYEQPGLVVYALRPNLFQHVGAYSSNKAKSTGVVEHESLEFVPLLVQSGQMIVGNL